MDDYSILLGALEGVLGKSSKRARDNYAFSCPFCNHKKPKLEIKLNTDSNGNNPWECWVCSTRGRTVKSLLYQLKLPKDQAQDILKYVHNTKRRPSAVELRTRCGEARSVTPLRSEQGLQLLG